jgi:hypothetical protein
VIENEFLRNLAARVQLDPNDIQPEEPHEESATERKESVNQLASRKNPFHKHHTAAMPTEVAAAEAKLRDEDPERPLKVGGAAHKVLLVYASVAGELNSAMTAYEASKRACDDYHAKRRESRRLFDRKYLEKVDFELPNPAQDGRHVEAFRITQAGLDWARANPWPA